MARIVTHQNFWSEVAPAVTNTRNTDTRAVIDENGI